MTRAGIVIVGAGRVGQSLRRALEAAGEPVTLLPARSLEAGAAPFDALATAATVVIAVRDDAIVTVAARLAEAALPPGQVVLHTSGLLTHAVLDPLRRGSAALGSWHALMTFRDPAGSPGLFRGTPAVLEGDRAAVDRARQLAATLGMTPILEVDPAEKPRYHAAAVLASNALVVLAATAARLAGEAGVPGGTGLFLPLMRRTLDHLAEGGAPTALTGPVARGDAGTVAAHLAALEGPTRELYRRLGLEALTLAGLPGEAGEAMRAALAAGDDLTAR